MFLFIEKYKKMNYLERSNYEYLIDFHYYYFILFYGDDKLKAIVYL